MKRARDILSRDLITVYPETPVSEVADLFNLHGIGGCPVVDDEGKLQGLVTRTGLLDYVLTREGVTTTPILAAAAPGLAGTKGQSSDPSEPSPPLARDVMTRNVLTVDLDTPVGEIAYLMSSEFIHRVPVMDGDEVVGILTTLDLLRLFPRN